MPKESFDIEIMVDQYGEEYEQIVIKWEDEEWGGQASI
jgi:hypothetical protein